MANAGQAKFDASASERKNISPDFSNQNKKNDSSKPGSDKDQANPNKTSEAEQNLANAEQNATDAPINDDENLDEIGGKEFNPLETFINKASSANVVTRFAFNKLHGKGPVAMIILILIIVGTSIIGSQSLMPFSLAEQLREGLDGLEVSANLRSKVMFKYQLQNEGVKSITKTKLSGGETFKVTKYQTKKLAQDGITVHKVEVDGGKSKKILLYDDGTGQKRITVADSADIDLVKKLIKNGEIEIGDTKIKVDPDDIKTHQWRYQNEEIYRNKNKHATGTWARSVGHWFDQKTADFLDNFAITRKIFGNFIERVRDEDIMDARARVSETIENSGIQGTNVVYEDTKTADGTELEDAVDEEGNKTKNRVNSQLSMDSDNSEKDSPEIREKNGVNSGVNMTKNQTLFGFKLSKKTVESAQIARQKMDQVQSIMNSRAYKTAGAIVNYGCMVLDVFGAALLIASAQETVQLLKVGTSYLETVDKTRAGDGEAAPIHILANALLAKFDTVNQVASEDGSTVTSEVVGTGVSAMESQGIASYYTDQKIDPKDPSVQTFNLSTFFDGVWAKFSLGVEMFTTCSLAKIAINTASAIITGASIIAGAASCLATGGLGCLGVLLGGAIAKVGDMAARAAAQRIVMAVVTPMATQFLANIFLRNLIEDLGGEHYGNAIVSAATKYMSGNYRSGGASLADKLHFMNYRAAQEKVLAENAEYERSTRSPFDPTSEHTFLGSIMKQIITLSTIKNSPVNIVSGMSSMVGGSILAMFPTASAADQINDELIPDAEFNDACPYLASIGAVGDAYCNPYIITDMSTIDDDPGEIENALVNAGELEVVTDSEGDQRVQIKDGSELAKYVLFCGQRTSQFGLMDSNIANAISNDSFLTSSSDVVNMGVGMTPVIGDIASILEDKDKLINMGWISGESCVAGNDTYNSWDSTVGVTASTNTYNATGVSTKIRQRWTEDQRQFALMDPSYASAVDEYIGKYYEAHPLDNSYEGVLARFSGLEKDTVVAVLDYVKYAMELTNYDPSERYVFKHDFSFVQKLINLDSEGDNSVSLLQHEVVYADVRNRAFAMA